MAHPFTYINDPSGPHDTLEPGDDLEKPIRETLAKYVSKLTTDPKTGNEYSINPSLNEFQTQDQNGNPATLDISNNGANQVFASHNTYPGLTSYSDSGLGDPSLEKVVKKGAVSHAPATAKSGHNLLPSVNNEAFGPQTFGQFSNPGNAPDNLVIKRTSSVLNKNRFNPGIPFYASAETSPETDQRHVSTIQREFGVYDPNGKEITNDMLRKIGPSLMLRATGELLARGQGADPETNSVNVTALLPGEAQLAVTKIDSIDMEAGEAFRELFGEEISGKLESNQSNNVDSYGVLNNYVEPFTSLAPAGMIALATALILASQVAIRAILAIVGVITGGKTSSVGKLARDAQGRPFLGDFRLSNFDEGSLFSLPPFIPVSLLGLRETSFDYIQAATKGLDVFFGSTAAGGGIGGAIAGGFARATEAPGYYAVFVRNITRSANTIANSVSNVANSGNIMDTANGIIGVIDTIKSSKIVAAINIFAQIGDKALLLEAQGFDTTKIAKGNNRISTIDNLPDNLSTHQMKSRTRGSLKLAWRNASTPSVLALPDSFVKAGVSLTTELQINPFTMMKMEPINAFSKIKRLEENKNRIDANVVEFLEAELEAEYVPFYFHDLRTNEIISFHAFLEDVSDSYSPNYDTNEAYGRVDPVYVYKNTVRQIALTFVAAATNPDDFDEMWVKINKLITMVYPQYSAGKEVITDDGKKFIQPFSQVISSSPLIRLRLGDLFKTNYSKFALGRLFGLGTQKFDVGDTKKTIDVEKVQKAIEAIQTRYQAGDFKTDDIVRLKANSGPESLDYTFGYPPETAFGQGGIGDAIGSAVSSAVGISSQTIPPLLLTYPVKARILKSIDIPYVGNNGIGKIFSVQIEEPDSSILPDSSVGYAVNVNDLFIEPEDIKQRAYEKLGIDNDSPLTKTDEFFSSNQNPIVRSFESIGGKGLAGVITSLQFSEIVGSNTTWDTERYGSRAPKYLKLSINFSPIHDISPGLDHNGFARSFNYNVGDIVGAMAGDGKDSAGAGKQSFEDNRREVNKNINSKKG